MNLWIISGLLLLGEVYGKGCTTTTTTTADDQACELGVTHCEEQTSYPSPVCYNEACMTTIRDHISHEFNAAFQYLYMGAVFGQYIKERQGMAKFFLDAATEERGHAIQMMDYLNMRGFEYNENYKFLKNNLWKKNNASITDGLALVSLTIKEALQEAVTMEIKVTEKILKVVAKCADDYHAADVFTNPILEEQYTGLRKLQGAIRNYDALMTRNLGNEELVEFIFDQKVLKGEIL